MARQTNRSTIHSLKNTRLNSPIFLVASVSLAIVFVIFWGVETENEKTVTKNAVLQSNYPQTGLAQSDVHLAFLLNTRSPYYNDDLQLLAKNLRSGDYLFIIMDSNPSLANQLMQQAKSLCSDGVNVNTVLLYSKLQKIVDELPMEPKGMDWIVYDYESGSDFSPEFTINENSSLGYFDKAKEAVEKYNVNTASSAKFMVTPPYGELKKGNWNWGFAAQHMDGIDVQTQRLVKNMSTFKDQISNITDQIQELSSNKFFMIQFSLRPSVGTINDTLNGINNVKDLRINAFLIFYDQYSKNSQLEKFFNSFHRS
jgi:hypothetical protein